MRLIAVLILLCAAAVSGFPARADEAAIYLNTGVRAPWTATDRSGFLDKVVAEAFRRLGRRAEIVVYESAERAMLNADSGVDDGAAMRVRGIEKEYPNLIRVDEKVVDNEFVAYAASARFSTDSYADLRPYSIAYIVGWKVFERNLGPDFAVTVVQDADQLFNLLAAGRVDVALYERWQGAAYLHDKGIKAELLSPPLARVEMFMYLHRKHAHLAAPVADALRAMKADGAYERILQATLASPAPAAEGR
jgi:polar amino acid transport system substrate-binding protein